jgi:succinyl-CoA synthetase beta subunit
VLKIASPDILHKSDIGGVRLGLNNEEAVREAFAQIMQAAQAIEPAPRIEGVLISPMRTGGVELLIGITRDANWGQVLTVGLGGIWVEILKDTSLRVLPVSRAEVHTMLTELQGAKLLQGARGAKAVDLDAVVEVIYQIAELAQRLKTNLEALEINPLRVDGSQIEALDAVITWQ